MVREGVSSPSTTARTQHHNTTTPSPSSSLWLDTTSRRAEEATAAGERPPTSGERGPSNWGLHQACMHRWDALRQKSKRNPTSHAALARETTTLAESGEQVLKLPRVHQRVSTSIKRESTLEFQFVAIVISKIEHSGYLHPLWAYPTTVQTFAILAAAKQKIRNSSDKNAYDNQWQDMMPVDCGETSNSTHKQGMDWRTARSVTGGRSRCSIRSGTKRTKPGILYPRKETSKQRDRIVGKSKKKKTQNQSINVRRSKMPDAITTRPERAWKVLKRWSDKAGGEWGRMRGV